MLTDISERVDKIEEQLAINSTKRIGIYCSENLQVKIPSTVGPETSPTLADKIRVTSTLSERTVTQETIAYDENNVTDQQKMIRHHE